MPRVHKLHPSGTRWAAPTLGGRRPAKSAGIVALEQLYGNEEVRATQSDGPPWKSSETRPPSQQPRSSHELGILLIQETNKTSNRGDPPEKRQKQLGAMRQRSL